jgi:hypothetical protein
MQEAVNRIEDRILYVKSRKGNVVRLVREQYLRKDIVNQAKEFKQLALKRETGNHYIIPDLEITKKYLELLETPDIRNIIFSQTVTRELKEQSSNVYNRLRKITNDERTNSFVFCNESFIGTYIEQKADETITERHKRAIWVMLLWLTKKHSTSNHSHN